MNKDEREHLSRVAALGCIICHRPAEIHHINCHTMGRKASHYATIPLCETHHRLGGYGVAVHAGKRTWEARFGTERELLERVMTLIYGTRENWPVLSQGGQS